MKKLKYILIGCITLIKVNSFYAQPDSLIFALEAVLFPFNTESEKSIILEEFDYAKERYVVVGRKYQPQKTDAQRIETLLWKIRQTKDVSVIPQLIELERRFEDNFIHEWEKAYRIGHYMFEFQYEVLMNMEMSLTSLYLEGFSSSREKYDYLKNIYMLQWGDGDKKRKEKIRFFSNYIKEKWNGGCLASSFCSPTLIIEKANDLEEGILNDMSCFDPDSLTGMFIKNYYLGILGNAAVQMNTDKIEEIYIKRINEFDSIMPDTIFYGRNTWIFEVIGRRGRVRGIDFILNELDSEDILKLPGFKFGRLCYTETGKEIVENRLIQEIQKSKGEMQSKYLALLVKYFYSKYQENPVKIKQLSKMVDKENLPILQGFIEGSRN